MIRAHSVGHILSDNGFYNFGWLQGNVVIIDVGSRGATVMRRGEFNIKVTSTFWSNLRLLVHPTTLEKHRQQNGLVPDATEVFIVGSVSGKAGTRGKLLLHSLSPADGLCIVEVMAAVRRTRAITSETH